MRWFRDNGNRIDVAVLTTGVSGVDTGFAGATSAGARAAVRESEQRASCERFGLPAECLDFAHLEEDERGHPVIGAANRAVVAGFLSRTHADIVFLPHGRDTNVAHQRVHQLVAGIVRDDALAVMLAMSEDPKTTGIRRDLAMEFDEPAAAWKAGLLRLHASQQARNLRARGRGFDERILDVNRKAARAMNLASPYAETFEIA